MSTISRSSRHRDVRAAIDFLCEAFGFERHALHEDGVSAAAPAAAGPIEEHAGARADAADDERVSAGCPRSPPRRQARLGVS